MGVRDSPCLDIARLVAICSGDSQGDALLIEV
jgi:hypothetical protein